MNRKRSKVLRKEVNAARRLNGAAPWPARRFRIAPTFHNGPGRATFNAGRHRRNLRRLHALTHDLGRQQLQEQSKRALDAARRGLFNRRRRSEPAQSRSFLGRMFRRRGPR